MAAMAPPTKRTARMIHTMDGTWKVARGEESSRVLSGRVTSGSVWEVLSEVVLVELLPKAPESLVMDCVSIVEESSFEPFSPLKTDPGAPEAISELSAPAVSSACGERDSFK